MEIEERKLVDNWPCFYLLESNEILSSNEYWDLHRETNWNHSPAIKSSTNKLMLAELARKRKDENHE